MYQVRGQAWIISKLLYASINTGPLLMMLLKYNLNLHMKLWYLIVIWHSSLISKKENIIWPSFISCSQTITSPKWIKNLFRTSRIFKYLKNCWPRFHILLILRMKNPFHHQIKPTKVFRFQSGLKSVKSMSRMIWEGYFEIEQPRRA